MSIDRRIDEWTERISDEALHTWDERGWYVRSWFFLVALWTVSGLLGLIVGWILNQLVPAAIARRICLVLLAPLALALRTLDPSIFAFVFMLVVQAIGILVGTQQKWNRLGRS